MYINTSQSNGCTPFDGLPNIYPKTDGGITDRDHRLTVLFVSSPSAGDIPQFLEHRRSQIKAKLRSVAGSVYRLADRVKVSEALIQELSSGPETAGVLQAIEQERGRLQVWALALEMKRSELASIAALLGVAA